MCTYIDIATTMALYGFDKKGRVHVSGSLSTNFMSPVKVGEEMQIEARIDKIGKGLAFTSCFIRDARG